MKYVQATICVVVLISFLFGGRTSCVRDLNTGFLKCDYTKLIAMAVR